MEDVEVFETGLVDVPEGLRSLILFRKVPARRLSFRGRVRVCEIDTFRRRLQTPTQLPVQLSPPSSQHRWSPQCLLQNVPVWTPLLAPSLPALCAIKRYSFWFNGLRNYDGYLGSRLGIYQTPLPPRDLLVLRPTRSASTDSYGLSAPRPGFPSTVSYYDASREFYMGFNARLSFPLTSGQYYPGYAHAPLGLVKHTMLAVTRPIALGDSNQCLYFGVLLLVFSIFSPIYSTVSAIHMRTASRPLGVFSYRTPSQPLLPTRQLLILRTDSFVLTSIRRGHFAEGGSVGVNVPSAPSSSALVVRSAEVDVGSWTWRAIDLLLLARQRGRKQCDTSLGERRAILHRTDIRWLLGRANNQARSPGLIKHSTFPSILLRGMPSILFLPGHIYSLCLYLFFSPTVPSPMTTRVST
ncbi:hypothetical protein C8R45DRAFT_1223609 [Mycena sanguinolenta]|nr:hypothetical protein C8R45DRAFT_1223609 [Mycena sanguinolenta]